MSVLIEATSVVIKKRAIEERFPGGSKRCSITPSEEHESRFDCHSYGKP